MTHPLSKIQRTLFAAIYTIALALSAISCAENGGDSSQSTTESAAASKQDAIIVMETRLGDITLQIDAQRAPISAANFLRHVDIGFYNGTVFHRVIDGFMVQGGGFDRDMQQKQSAAPISNEADNGLKNIVGSIAMARTSAPHSASSQFFINTAENDFLDHQDKTPRGWGYAVFGHVIDGMATVETISDAATGRHGRHQNVPLEAIVIERAYRSDRAVSTDSVEKK